jgi:hypothetical protein
MQKVNFAGAVAKNETIALQQLLRELDVRLSGGAHIVALHAVGLPTFRLVELHLFRHTRKRHRCCAAARPRCVGVAVVPMSVRIEDIPHGLA